MSARQLGSQTRDDWVYLHWNSCIIQICCWTWLFHSDGLQASWVEDKLNYSWFFFENTFIIREGTMPVITIQLYEQRLNFSIWSYHWHRLVLIDQPPFHSFVMTPWCFFEPPLPFFSPHGSIWPDQSAQSISLTIVMGSGLVLWFKLVQWFSTLRVLVNYEREALYWDCLAL